MVDEQLELLHRQLYPSGRNRSHSRRPVIGDKMRAEFQRRRDAFVTGLNKIKGFSCCMPKGAFYVFPNTQQTGWKSKKLVETLLEEAGVACLSGNCLWRFREGYLRFSVANSLENLRQVLGRIRTRAATNI